MRQSEQNFFCSVVDGTYLILYKYLAHELSFSFPLKAGHAGYTNTESHRLSWAACFLDEKYNLIFEIGHRSFVSLWVNSANIQR